MTRKLKKIAAVVLAVAMLISSFAVGSFAAGTATGNEAMNVNLALSAESAKPGDEITVTISISNNYNAAVMRLPVLFSKAVFEYVEDSLVAEIDNVTVIKGATDTTISDEFIPASYSADTYSAFAIQWIALSDGTKIGAFKSESAVACFSFKLKVLEAAEGTGSVLIPSDSDKFYKGAVGDTADATSYYEAPVSFTVSQAANVTIEAAYTAPELIALGDTIIDRERGFIYGLPHGDIGGVTDLVSDGYAQVTNGTVVCTSASDILGTGSKVELVDSNGAVVETYYVVIFGDTDGDGYITTDDIADAKRWYAYLDSANDYEDFSNPVAFAMEINGDDFVDDSDFAIVSRYYAYLIDDVPQTR